jgi:hypothetical protein
MTGTGRILAIRYDVRRSPETEMRHQTGETAPQRGVYYSNCKCRSELRVRRGDVFTACPKCQKPVTWLFVRSFTSDEPLPPDAKRPPSKP